MSKARRGSRWVGVALVAALVAPLMGSIDEREFACEEAQQRVDDCCEEAHRIADDFRCGGGCDSVQLDFAQADYLRNASCGEIVQSGACADATMVVPR